MFSFSACDLNQTTLSPIGWKVVKSHSILSYERNKPFLTKTNIPHGRGLTGKMASPL
jgi:hypothetical protein